MKKVLFIVNSLPFFLSHREPIAEELVNNGYEVHLAAGKFNMNPPDRIIWHELPIEPGGTNIIKEVKLFFAIYKLIKKTKPDLIHLVTIKPVLYAGVLSLLFPKISVVSAISGLGSVFTNKEKFKILYFLTSNLYKLALLKKKIVVIFQNKDDKRIIQNLTNLPEIKTCLIRGSGVNLDQFSYSDELSISNGINVIMISRLLKDKGVFEYVEAAKILQYQNINFSIVGTIDPNNPESLTSAEVQSLSSVNNLSILGFKSNIKELISDSHIVVLPSYREGLPKVLCEAAACGRAVITTDVPGCRDAVDSESGILVPRNNSEELSIAVLKLCTDHDLRKDLGKAGRRLAEKEFDIKIIVQKHIEVYNSLLKNSNNTK